MTASDQQPSNSVEPELSVVIPFHNEEETIAELFRRLSPVLKGLGIPYEILCVDDGSRDRTWSLIRTFQELDPRIRGLRLSRNFGKEIAMTAGLDAARGQAAVIIDADLQDPPELIPEFITKWREGYQNVYGIRVDRAEDSIVKRTTASIFYRLFNKLSETKLPPNAGDFRLMGPAVLAALRTCRERQRFMKGLYSWVGFPSVGISYKRPARVAGTTKFNALRLWNFALEGITAHSTVLLRAWTYVGLAAILLSVILTAWLIVEYLAFDQNPPGFYVTIIVILAFSSLNMLTLGIFGEYIGRIYEEVKERPLYLLREDDLDI